MIPYKLEIKNFLSYGPETQTIDLSGHHLICLSGKNGHGKSAFLDAITWGIWGQARKTSGNSKADQGLLHLGQKHMSVIIEFEVNQQHYRIRREYVQTKSKPFSSLDFGIMESQDSIISLTDKTIKATQQKIEKTIGITYDSFINSAFLRQGQSNEFSKKSPKERKDVLAKILQLQQFEDQKKIAQNQAKVLHQEYKTACGIQEHIQQELAELSTIEATFKEIEQTLQKKLINKKEFDKKLDSAQNNKQKLHQKIQEENLITKQREKLQSDFINIKKSIQTIADQWRKTEQASKKYNLKKIEEEKKELQKKLQLFQTKLEKRLHYKEEYLQVKEKLSQYIQEEQTAIDKKLHEQQVTLTKHQEQKLSIENQQKKINNTLQDLQKEEQELSKDSSIKDITHITQQYESEKSILDKIKAEYTTICSQGKSLKNQLQEINHNLETSLNKTKSCFVCSQSLTNNAQDSLKHNLDQKLTIGKEQLQQAKKEALSLQSKKETQEEVVKKLETEYENLLQLTINHKEQQKLVIRITEQINNQKKELSLLEKTEKTNRTQIQNIEKVIIDLQNEKKNLTKHKKYISLQKTLDSIEINAKKLNYNQQEHKAIQQQLESLDTIMEQQESINNEQAQAERKAELLSLFKTAKQIVKQIEEESIRLNLYQSTTKEYNEVSEKEIELKNTIQSIEKDIANLLVQKGSAEQKQLKQKTLFKELTSREKTIKTLHQELSDYLEIAKALGKDGIQALLIEQAIPEIEDEANEILARLTNNQTQIFIESLRDLKKGGSKETLDIKISDSFGLRDYELFSGGEAFRIDFALRIGISKLLARKAGTTLQSIFIDEGFGSQDEEGLQLIMDNIYKIQDDFAKVIIVSHLPEMKEQFPVQFIVEKKRSGSTISIVEQG